MKANIVIQALFYFSFMNDLIELHSDNFPVNALLGYLTKKIIKNPVIHIKSSCFQIRGLAKEGLIKQAISQFDKFIGNRKEE